MKLRLRVRVREKIKKLGKVGNREQSSICIVFNQTDFLKLTWVSVLQIHSKSFGREFQVESVTIYFDSFEIRSHLTEICREVVKNSKLRGEGSWICCVF